MSFEKLKEALESKIPGSTLVDIHIGLDPREYKEDTKPSFEITDEVLAELAESIRLAEESDISSLQ